MRGGADAHVVPAVVPAQSLVRGGMPARTCTAFGVVLVRRGRGAARRGRRRSTCSGRDRSSKAFHLPGGDGWAVMVAGGWAVLLLIWRLFDTARGRHQSPIGVQWGMFVAIAVGGRAARAAGAAGAGRAPARAAEPGRRGGGTGSGPARDPAHPRALGAPVEPAAVTEVLRDDRPAGRATCPSRPAAPGAPSRRARSPRRRPIRRHAGASGRTRTTTSRPTGCSDFSLSPDERPAERPRLARGAVRLTTDSRRSVGRSHAQSVAMITSGSSSVAMKIRPMPVAITGRDL